MNNNIFNTSNETSNLIDNKKIQDINNQFKNNAPNKRKRIIVLIIIIIFFFIGAYGILKFSKKIVNYESKDNNSTKLTMSRIEEYINNNKMRKFENDNYIFMLLPDNINRYNEDKYYILMANNTNEIKIGTYNIEKEIIKLKNDNELMNIDILDDTLRINSDELNIHETEMKYYIYSDENEVILLLINGTIDKEQAFLFVSNKQNTNVYNYDYNESLESIILANGNIYNKISDGLENDGKILKYIN